jgi:prepilin-type N-terminal cleavage/methylation domain-containing protein
MSSSCHRQRGFTLIEMLISLTVMAVMLMLIGGALRVMGRNWDANAARIESLDMVSRAFDLLARDAANLRPICSAVRPTASLSSRSSLRSREKRAFTSSPTAKRRTARLRS